MESWVGQVCTFCKCRYKGHHSLEDCRANVMFERDDALAQITKQRAENLRLVVEMDELKQTIQDQAEIIERYETRV